MSDPSPFPVEIGAAARLEAAAHADVLDSGPDAAFDRLAGLAAWLLHAPSAFITVADEHRSYRKARVGVAATTASARENPVHDGFFQHVTQASGPVVIGDTSTDPRMRDDPSVMKLGAAAWAGFPLVSPDGVLVGSFCVIDTVTREWSEPELAILRTLADAAAAEVALVDALAEERAARKEAARSLERERRALKRAETLMLAGVALSERNDAASVLRALVGATVPDIGVWCAVHLRRRGSGPELVAAGHRDPAQEATVRALDDGDDPWLQTRLVTPVILFDRPRTFLVTEEDDTAHLGAGEVVSLPLRVRGHTIGTLTVGVNPDDEPDALSTIAGLAGQAAVALENAGLYDEQAEVARILQQALVPGKLPDIAGVELAARFRPAGANIQVGGDFYDVFATPNRTEKAFVVGDVAGKGPVAATLTGVVRHTLRAAFFRGDGPCQAVALANQALYDVADTDKFCTAIYGHLEVADGHVAIELVRAGHPAALVLRGAGDVEVLLPAGGILGYRLDVTWQPMTVRLGPGDALLLYTDGAVEFPRRKDIDGEQALRTLVGELAGTGARELVEAIEHQTIVLSDGPLRDDLALLVIRCLPGQLPGNSPV
ncbi:MAG: Serine phosphatase RsbU, regulator of sigma subunit [Solirubrobacterales bacterium]|nr:Serine phosphatase RsbU, regulator of sigma subunit [Solirubrobacterales bacterium]